jgi:DNA-binding LytR/AlgR family response regulator
MSTVSMPVRVALHVDRNTRRLVDPAAVFLLEAEGAGTAVRLAGRTPLRDARSLGELAGVFEPYGFVRVHRNHAVNLALVRELRRREGSDEWELKMEPPVNRVLPIARGELKTVLALLG